VKGSENMSVLSILPYTFKLLENTSEEYIQKTFDAYQVPDERFVVEYYDKQQIEGVYIFIHYFKENIFDYNKNDFNIVNSSKSVAVQFHIDLSSNTLDIWGGKKNAQKLITALTVMFENKIVLESYEISFEKTMSYLKSIPNISIGTVKVEDVSFDKDIVASCTFNLATHSNPFMVLDKYNHKISKITFVLVENNDNSVQLSIYQSGAIVIYKNRNYLSALTIEKIQNLLEASRGK
jgi:hypothetical protein